MQCSFPKLRCVKKVSNILLYKSLSLNRMQNKHQNHSYYFQIFLYIFSTCLFVNNKMILMIHAGMKIDSIAGKLNFLKFQ